MNRFIKISLLFLSLVIFSIVFIFLILAYVINTNGLPIDFLNQNIKNYISNKIPVADFKYSEGYLKFNEEKNLYLDLEHVEFVDKRSNFLFKLKDVQVSNLDELVRANNLFPKVNIDNINIFNSLNEEILNVNAASINCNTGNLKLLFENSKINNKCRLISQNISFIKPILNQNINLKPIIDFNLSSLIQGNNFDFSFKSEIEIGDNQSIYYLEGDYFGDKKLLNLSNLNGKNFYLSEPGLIAFTNNSFSSFSLNLKINSKIGLKYTRYL